MAEVKGYTPLSDDQKSAMNYLKETEERIIRSLEGWSDLDPRWKAIAITDLQKAFMSANRAIAKPQRLTFPEDTNLST